VDARPPPPPEDSFVGVSSDSGGANVDQVESPPPASEKVQGKRPAVDEPAQKKRKIAPTAPIKPGGISLGGDQATRTRRAAVIEWSDDDEDPVDILPSVQTSSRNTRMEEQSGGAKKVPEQQTTENPAERATVVPEQHTEANLERRAEENPEQQAEQRPNLEETRPLPPSTRINPTVVPRGSSGHR